MIIKYIHRIDASINASIVGITGACPDGRVVLGVATDCLLSLITIWVWMADVVRKKVGSDLVLGGGFCWVLRFLHLSKLASHNLDSICQKSLNTLKYNLRYIWFYHSHIFSKYGKKAMIIENSRKKLLFCMVYGDGNGAFQDDFTIHTSFQNMAKKWW